MAPTALSEALHHMPRRQLGQTPAPRPGMVRGVAADSFVRRAGVADHVQELRATEAIIGVRAELRY